MSDEQWLWLFVNQRIDADEKLEGMCPKCREEVTSGHKCSRCGRDIIKEESFINPNFDMDRYNELSGHVEKTYNEDDISVEEV
jgi:methionyl-tRNA synthetase